MKMSGIIWLDTFVGKLASKYGVVFEEVAKIL